MTAKDVFKSTIEMTHGITKGYLSDMSDADLLVRSSPAANHTAWQLGHLIGSAHFFLSAIGKAVPTLPDGFKEQHSKEAATSDDPRKFLTKAAYLQLMQATNDAAIAAINSTPDADLDKPGPAETKDYAPTIGAVFNLIGLHEMMHSGQIVAVRRKLGKPVQF